MLLYTLPSLLEVIVTQPLDVLKTKYQSGSPFHMRDMYRGFLFRGLSFMPVRTVFWWSQHNSPTQNIFGKILFTSITQSMFDVPLDYMKIRTMNHITTPHSFQHISKVAIAHTMRNTVFCAGFMVSQKYIPPMNVKDSIATITIGSMVGTILSHPLDVVKTKWTTYQKWVWRDSLLGFLPRMTITTFGLMIGQIVLLQIQ